MIILSMHSSFCQSAEVLKLIFHQIFFFLGKKFHFIVMKFICIKAITMIKDLQALANLSLGTLFYKL